MAAKALALKDEGNKRFGRGDYAAADALYSEAILVDSKNPALYTNRALTRLKLEMWQDVVTDCNTCLDLAQNNMKAYYYRAQAELGLKDYEAALADALRAHALCVQTSDKSLTNVTELVLNCKKERWAAKERARVRERAQLEAELAALLARERDAALDGVDSDTDRADIAKEYDDKLATLHDTFEKARSASEKRREVPEWAVDDISFGIMVDPVVTKSGKSYERASILEHLRRQQTDPITREPMTADELRPNLDLKQACAEFLEENGWAVDY